MSTSNNAMSDEVIVTLNPSGPEPDFGTQPDRIPDRPADSASKDTWVDYVVALGADRAFVTSDTEHFDGNGWATEPGLTKGRLIDLADRLGG